MSANDILAGTGFAFDADASENFMPTWVHESAPVWIREYEAIDGVRTQSNFYVYRSVARVPRGRRPWTVDNRRVHDERSPPHTLADALEVARTAVGATA